MKAASTHPDGASPRKSNGIGFGMFGTLCFSLTLPATRLAVSSFDPLIVGMGRTAIASCFAGIALCMMRQPFPTGGQLKRILLVALTVTIGFPNLSSWAMQRVDVSHGAVVLGLLPLGTAIASYLRSDERPSIVFWYASFIGSATVIVFALSSGFGKLQSADIALFGAVILCSFGYAEGASLSREMGGWQVISWSLVVSFPLIVIPLFFVVKDHGLVATWDSWAGLAYLSSISSFLGFFAWYRGLAEGGTARVSQCQLLQPFFTLSFVALFFSEKVPMAALISAAVVAGSIFVSGRSPMNEGQIL
jgi:drug/metabolite transporter (DMT)-like permease